MKLALSRIIDNPIQYFLFRVDVILRHLYDHYAILPLAMLTFIFFKKKKDKNLFQKNKLILFLIFISIVFLLIHSITIYNPRYGVISSFYLSYFLWILILKVFLEKNVYS
jgi:membrane-associated HD superfamily phosphohydrolase